MHGNFLSEERIALYQSRALNQNMSLLQYIAHENILNTKQIASSVAQFFAVPLVDLDSFDIATIPNALINDTLIMRHRFVPLFQQNNQLYVATDDPSQLDALQDIQFRTGLLVTPRVVDAHQLSVFITQLIHQKENQGLTDYAASTQRAALPHTRIEKSNEEDPVVHFVKRILSEAIEQNASDIHFEPYEHEYRIRYRQDGVLMTAASPPPALSSRITARLKVLAHLDTSERRVPQDGRFRMRFTDTKSVDFRVSTCPTVWGEKMVLRLLDVSTTPCDVEILGFSPQQKDQFLTAIARPEGMVLVTGPTGSGKTMTLYAALNTLNTMDRNISAVEDPVEINLSGINQVNINPKAGLTFASALRAFLRQDPDVIMVGEIRDLETAEIAVKASHTGHLVLSTLHTNSASETLTRLLNMGVPGFNIASTVRLIVAQRLVRRLCSNCKFIRTDLTPEDLVNIGFAASDATTLKSYQARGCPQCTGGFRGRVAIFEVMPMSKHIAHLIMAERHAMDLLQQAKTEGMITLYEAGLLQVRLGVTTIEEVKRVIID